MKTVTRNEVDFSEIFEYAEKKFGIGWNPCNDLFFREEVLTFRSYDEFTKYELLEHIENPDAPFEELNKTEKAYFIIYQFMVDNNAEDIWIDNR